METTQFTIRRDGLICLGLVLAVLAVFGQLHAYDFIMFDDDVYVTKNEQVRQGLSLNNLLWAFTHAHGLWTPLATVSHMLDCTLFGLNAGGHHLMNVGFHAANTILLFLTLRLMGGGSWRSAFVAALFALHPLHVEPVAWISSRKDMLSTFFWLLTMIAYIRYVSRSRPLWYFAALVCFCLGLLAKPMVLTVLGVMFLMDYWPLGRLDDFVFRSAQSWKKAAKLLVEKIPFMMLAAASLLAAFVSEKTEGTLPSLAHLSITERLSTACINYFTYLTMTAWPIDLSVYYPYPNVAPPLWKLLGALTVLLAVSVVVILRRRAQPYLFFGWVWYLGTLVPVIGLAQAGTHLMADRYTYVTLIGVFLMVAWGCADLAATRPRLKTPLTCLASAALIACSVGAWRQTGLWRDSISLFSHALAVTEDNALMHYNLGVYLHNEGKVRESIPHFKEALRVEYIAQKTGQHSDIPPEDSLRCLGVALLEIGSYEQARRAFSMGVHIQPDNPTFRVNLGAVLFQENKMEAAVEHLSKAVELGAQPSEVHGQLAVAYGSLGDWQRAAHHLSESFRIDSSKDNAHFVLALTHMAEGEVEPARSYLEKALHLNPNHALADKVLRSISEAAPVEQDRTKQTPTPNQP